MRAGSCLSSGLSPRLSDLRLSAISGPRRRLSPLEPGPRAPSGCPLTTRSRTAYTLNLHQKLTWEAYIVHLTAWPSCPRSTSGARPFTAKVSRPRRDRIRVTASAGKIRQTARRQRPRFPASISPDIRIAGHERRNAVKHVFQARFELPLPPVLGESRR